MKLDCGPGWETKKARREQWHRWFAWRPVRVADHDCRWLEWIERKGTYVTSWYDAWWRWEYRA